MAQKQSELSKTQSTESISFIATFILSGMASITAETCTYPLDASC